MPSQSITPEQTLSRLAVKSPVLIPKLFEKDLDFCCGGDRTLAEACTAKSLDPVAVAEELNEVIRKNTGKANGETWESAGIGSLIDHILVRFHQGHREVFPGLRRMAEKVLRAHGERYPFLVELKTVIENLLSDLEPHMQKEEIVLFPLILFLNGDSEKAPLMCHGADPAIPIKVMRVEHEQTGAFLARIRELTDSFHLPDGACRTFANLYTTLEELERDIQHHIHLENNVLFPRALDLAESR